MIANANRGESNVTIARSSRLSNTVPATSGQQSKAAAAPFTHGATPLSLDGWVEFTSRVYGLEPRRFHYGGHEKDQPHVDAVLYLDPRGRIRRPQRSPYISVDFKPSPSKYPHKGERQWITLAGELAEEMRRRGIVNALPLTPNIQDVRPWQWAGYRVSVSYTFMVDFPHPEEAISNKVRALVRRSEREGFRIERTNNIGDVHQCLQATEQRKGYRIGLTRDDLQVAYDLMGDDHFMATVAYAPNGEPASAVVNLHKEGSVGVSWLSGTKAQYLSTGVVAAVEQFTYKELTEAGATGLDLCGANIPGVAANKAAFGARLVPYYNIETYSARRLAKWMQLWWRYARLTPQG